MVRVTLVMSSYFAYVYILQPVKEILRGEQILMLLQQNFLSQLESDIQFITWRTDSNVAPTKLLVSTRK